MTDLPERHLKLAAAVLAKHWCISQPAVRTDLGVSRATWRVGSHYWLTQAEQTRSVELFHQAEIVAALGRYLTSGHSSISVPEIVATNNAELAVEDLGYVWVLTRNLGGYHPDASDPETYPVITEGLARFHKALHHFSQHQPMHVPTGDCVKIRQNIERLSCETFVAFTSYPREKEVLARAAAWLLPRLHRFECLPRQLIHGDWTPRNVLFQRDDHQALSLTGVLDFEAIAQDPIHVDLANTCSTLLMWSGLDRLDERVANVLETYERSAGVHLEREDIRTAMVAHWVCHYWNWRDRLRHAEFGREVQERLCLRISLVLSYVSKEA